MEDKIDFVKRTALDYGLDYDIVKSIYDKQDPSMFYVDLEEKLQENCIECPGCTKAGGASVPVKHLPPLCEV